MSKYIVPSIYYCYSFITVKLIGGGIYVVYSIPQMKATPTILNGWRCFHLLYIQYQFNFFRYLLLDLFLTRKFVYNKSLLCYIFIMLIETRVNYIFTLTLSSHP